MTESMDRPSRHGQFLGEALALIVQEGRKAGGASGEEPCVTCAFRVGTVPNMSAGTAVAALNCLVRIEDAEFACHHGIRDGEPMRPCAGYALALKAPTNKARAILEALLNQLARLGDEEGDPSYVDAIRVDFDAWLREIDPDRKMEVYQIARAFACRGR